MDSWQTAQNWVLFAGVAGGLSYYYWSQNKPTQSAATANRRRSVQETQPKAKRRATLEDGKTESKTAEKRTAHAAPKVSNEGAKKRKGQPKQQPQAQAAPAIAEEKEEDDEIDMSTKHFAEQLSKARKGDDLSASKGKEQRVRTVKQTSAVNAPAQSTGSSSQADADADDDMSPTANPAVDGGDVSDMLEPAAKAPSTLRLTAATKPQKEKAVRQPKQEDVETKKQRQNKMKKEQQRLEREADEKERKVAEEKQRRAARVARGEPAKNGIPVSKPPASNAWTAPKAGQTSAENATPAVNGTSSAPLLDTFDAESTASSNDGMKASTAATSTTEAETTTQRDHDGVSEEEQMAEAMKQSEDESGWTTVAVPKKQKKKQDAGEDANGNSSFIESTPTRTAAPPASKPAINGKPNGYQALEDQYEQRADVDPNDASNWDA
ncbi:hypothetical protein LTR36_000920 [Oleoguttula mirabilis]|uniref:Uncharacterized protein n=1 Tax=Oleoguttula mirabilis TaxID=1507867 RepID=A0AAV9JQM9_9PEZI|nr:hypothetical protein LTR36_000920 [Oleoguttula mirabilis]